MGAKQWNCKLAKEDFRQKLIKWHLTTKETLVRTNIGETYDQKWGSFLPNQHFNIYQSQCLLPLIWNKHIIFMNLVMIKIKKKCRFPSLAEGSKNISGPCKYVFVLMESNQGQVWFNTLTLCCSISSKKGTGIYIKLSKDISYYYQLITTKCLPPRLQ